LIRDFHGDVVHLQIAEMGGEYISSADISMEDNSGVKFVLDKAPNVLVSKVVMK